MMMLNIIKHSNTEGTQEMQLTKSLTNEAVQQFTLASQENICHVK